MNTLQLLYVTSDETNLSEFRGIVKSLDGTANLIHETKAENVPVVVNEDVVDIVFVDYNTEKFNITEFLNQEELKDEIPVVVLATDQSIVAARSVFKSGAFDFIQRKNLTADFLKEILVEARQAKTEMRLRKNLEKRLDSIYANTRAILDNTTDGIWSLNKSGRVLIINNVAKDNIREHGGQCPGVGEDFFTNIDSMFAEVWKPLFERALEGEHVTSVDRYREGEKVFFLEVACSPIYSAAEDSFGVTFIARNVTERERAEEKIRESEKNFRSVFTGSDVPIMLESQTDNRIVDLNEACANLHGYKRQEMIGMSVFDTIPPDHIEKSQENLQLYLNGKIDPLDSFVYTHDKEKIPVEISVAEIIYNEQKCNLIFLYDISQRKETEKKLNEARELAERTAEFKSLFLANMSHEIRTPMNAMIGFTDLLKKTNLSEEQTEYVDIISKSGQDLLVIINDVLDLSKIEAGKLKLRPRPFNIIEVASRLIRLHKNAAKEKQIELKLEIGGDIPDQIYLDDTRLSQILNNLISNAIKFTEKGTVLLSVDIQEELKIEVKDTGIGIPEKDLESIFENFNQVDSSLQRKYAGTGLGLSIVSQLTELMGGEISVSSEVGRGSVFKLHFPLSEIPEKDDISEFQKRKEIATADLKVLICEDNPINVKLASKILHDLGIHYEIATNGKYAVEKVKSFDPDVVLMDLQMPEMDGYEATKAIREFSSVPIIAMSAHVLEDEQRKCEEHGMSGFIPKPFKEGEIINQLSRHFKIESNNRAELNGQTAWSKLNYPALANMAQGDRDFALSIMDIYVENAQKELNSFESAVSANDQDEMARVAHKLLPSFILLDMIQLHIVGQKIENGSASTEEIKYFAEKLRSSIEEVSEKRSSFASSS